MRGLEMMGWRGLVGDDGLEMTDDRVGNERVEDKFQIKNSKFQSLQ